MVYSAQTKHAYIPSRVNSCITSLTTGFRPKGIHMFIKTSHYLFKPQLSGVLKETLKETCIKETKYTTFHPI